MSVVSTGRRVNQVNQSDLPVKVDDFGVLVSVDRYSELALRGKVFSVTVAAVTIPVNAATLVSVCSLYNPPGSGVFLDIISVDAHAVVATTVVDELGVYFSTPDKAILGTFTTRSTAIQNARLGEGAPPIGQFYTAYTHSGTPVLAGLVGGWGAVTDSGSGECSREFKGRLLLPPGCVASLAMTTAASTASGITAEIRYAEVPFVAL